jgi:hypothetical protein
MKVFRRCAVVAAGIGALVATSLPMAGSAAAAQPFEATLKCDNGELYEVEGNGNGDFTPVRDKNSNRVFVPISFGDFSGAIFDTNDVVVDTFTEEGTFEKGSGKQKSDAVCAFEFSEVSDGSDPEFPAGFTFVGTGTVVVKITGRS